MDALNMSRAEFLSAKITDAASKGKAITPQFLKAAEDEYAELRGERLEALQARKEENTNAAVQTFSTVCADLQRQCDAAKLLDGTQFDIYVRVKEGKVFTTGKVTAKLVKTPFFRHPDGTITQTPVAFVKRAYRKSGKPRKNAKASK